MRWSRSSSMTADGRRDRAGGPGLGWLGEEHAVGFADCLLGVEEARIEVESAETQPGGPAEAEAEAGASMTIARYWIGSSFFSRRRSWADRLGPRPARPAGVSHRDTVTGNHVRGDCRVESRGQHGVSRRTERGLRVVFQRSQPDTTSAGSFDKPTAKAPGR